MFEKVADSIRNPSLIARELNRLYYSKRNPSGYYEKGVDIFREDWDNLLILDACRYDTFKQYSTLPGRLESRISRAAATPEFLYGNFEDRELHDTVYVTANPQLYRREINCSFHRVDNIWLYKGWHEEHGTVLPETVTECALEAQDRFPEKRLVVHYMQPHYPFIDSDIGVANDVLEDDSKTRHIWMQLQTGQLKYTSEEVWEAYIANFQRALPHVAETIANLSGKTVVTSDHGNLFNEYIKPIPVRTWGHPRRIYVEELIQVPWLIIDSEERRKTSAEPPDKTKSDVSDEMVKSRLADLGYIE